jgi:ACR3 family arsenite efflux pump ArsB
MKLLDKIEPLLLLTAVGCGLLLERISVVSSLAKVFIAPFLCCMLIGLFWEAPLKDIRKSFQNVKFTFTSLALNFIWTPFFAWILVGLFMEHTPLLGLGFILLLATPCTDWYLVFTAMARGNLPLSVALLPINLITQVLLLPLYILILSGTKVNPDAALLLKSLALTLFLPFLVAKILKYLFQNLEQPTKLMENIFAKRQFVWLWLSILAMFASEDIFKEGYLDIFLIILIPTVIFFVATFLISRVVSRALRFPFKDSVSLSFTTLARNSPLALAFAQRAFPEDRQVLLPLIIGPLLELPILALIAQFIVIFLSKGKEDPGEARASDA